MNLITLLFLAISVCLIVLGLYLIHPPLALIAGGLISAGIGALFWDMEDK